VRGRPIAIPPPHPTTRPPHHNPMQQELVLCRQESGAEQGSPATAQLNLNTDTACTAQAEWATGGTHFPFSHKRSAPNSGLSTTVVTVRSWFWFSVTLTEEFRGRFSSGSTPSPTRFPQYLMHAMSAGEGRTHRAHTYMHTVCGAGIRHCTVCAPITPGPPRLQLSRTDTEQRCWHAPTTGRCATTRTMNEKPHQAPSSPLHKRAHASECQGAQRAVGAGLVQ
jgi:hypothetical protein